MYWFENRFRRCLFPFEYLDKTYRNAFVIHLLVCSYVDTDFPQARSAAIMTMNTIGNATAKTAALRSNTTPTSIQMRQLFMVQNLKRGCEAMRARTSSADNFEFDGHLKFI